MSRPPLKVVKLDVINAGDVAAMLRELASRIDEKEYDAALNLAWVIDCGNQRVELGLMGKAAEPAAVAHFLFAIGMHKLERAGCEP